MSEVITKPSAAWIEASIVETVERCMRPRPVLNHGKPTNTFTFEAAGALKGIELAAKLLGMFKQPSDGTSHRIIFNLDLPAKNAGQE